jgi:hypothetical protein
MSSRKRKKPASPPELVRKSVLLDAAKLERARTFLELPSDAEVLRFALDHLLSHFEEQPGEEE